MNNILCAILAFTIGTFTFAMNLLATETTNHPKEIEVIFENLGLFEENLRHNNWTEASRCFADLNHYALDLHSKTKMKPDIQNRLSKKINKFADQINESITAKDIEEIGLPFFAYQKTLLELIENLNVSIPPVFILISHHVDESLEHLGEGHFDAIQQEMEEIVNFREIARISTKGSKSNEDKVKALLDLAWDVSGACESKNSASAQKRLERMKLILSSI